MSRSVTSLPEARLPRATDPRTCLTRNVLLSRPEGCARRPQKKSSRNPRHESRRALSHSRNDVSGRPVGRLTGHLRSAMSLFADFRRRFDLRPLKSWNLAGSLARTRPEASSPIDEPCDWRESHGTAGTQRSAYLAIAEALHDGADVVPASDEVGRQLAADGVSLPEALDGLSALYRSISGGEPAFAAVRALSSSWAEASLVYLHSLSCEDPLTGLSSLAHLRSRLGELYREAEFRGTSVPQTHALVVVEPITPR